MVNDKSKVLVIEGNGVPIRRFLGKSSKIAYEFLEIPLHMRSEGLSMEDRVARHLMHNEYSLVLMDAEVNFPDAVRAQHLGRVIVYGIDTSFLRMSTSDLGRYDGSINVMDLIEDSSSVARSIERFLQ